MYSLVDYYIKLFLIFYEMVNVIKWEYIYIIFFFLINYFIIIFI